eukprot:TRINITY_DN7761_c0_g1_i1.p1 TRINITY_DN7761_c0_g1~~TRINITY_DN7761_c0_g1_i1.p1  ORF type:complete len:386 (+),score=42.77 TRINITY_DN7761_c0_g1_i1:311-1468(+)
MSTTVDNSETSEVQLEDISTLEASSPYPPQTSTSQGDFDREEQDYEDLEGVGIVLSDEPAAPVKPSDWNEKMKSFFLPKKGREKIYILGVVVDSLLFITWLILILTLVDTETRNKVWYMPVLGIFGATIAMATPAGGGVFYFPALTALKYSPASAIAFNYAAQTTGMGLFGTFNWLRKSRSNVILWLNAWVIFWGWLGTLISVFGVPISDDLVLRIIFAVFSLLLAIYVIVGLKRGTLKSQQGEVDPRSVKHLLGLAFAGLLGGVLMGWISVGIDITIFFALTAFWSVDSRRATVTSIIVIGWTSLLPLLIHIFRDNDVPYILWVMVLGGSILGAKIGPLINKLLGKNVMLVAFILLLFAEVIRTFIELAILPLFEPPNNGTEVM